MPTAATTLHAMGVEVPLLLWIGAGLLLLGLFFALAGRRPARRDGAKDASQPVSGEQPEKPSGGGSSVS